MCSQAAVDPVAWQQMEEFGVFGTGSPVNARMHEQVERDDLTELEHRLLQSCRALALSLGQKCDPLASA